MFYMEFIDQVPNLLKIIKQKFLIQSYSRKLCSIAPDQKTYGILQQIIKDEERHIKILSNIYNKLTGFDIQEQTAWEINILTFKDGLLKILEEEISCLNTYKDLYLALKKNEFRKMISEIILDEIKHSFELNLIGISLK